MMYRLISETKPVARKDHKCIWCGEKILKGTNYRRERSTYDGEMQDHKWHLECDDVAKEYFANEGGEAEFSAYDNERPVCATDTGKS